MKADQSRQSLGEERQKKVYSGRKFSLDSATMSEARQEARLAKRQDLDTAKRQDQQDLANGNQVKGEAASQQQVGWKGD